MSPLHRSFTAAIPPQTQKESMMKRTLSSAAIALILISAGMGLGNAQSTASPTELNVPTVIVTVIQDLPLSLSSAASYRLYNGGSVVSINSSGRLTVNGPTEIRFVVQGADGKTYSPVGVSFKESSHDASSGTLDPLGRAAFTTRTFIVHGNTTQLSVFDADPASAELELALVIQRPDGTLSLIDPPIENKQIG